jgi:transcriptional regulator with GAF, ATPase, and Fis domain
MLAEPILSLAVSVAAEHSVQGVLNAIVRGLAAQFHVALARIWLLSPGDICDSCFMRAKCLDQTQCLHLMASAGNPANSPGEDWTFLQGYFRRIPLEATKVGEVGTTETPILIKDFAPQNQWTIRPDWARRESIRGFVAHPLVFQGKILGVLALFSRECLSEQDSTWISIFAKQAAVAIANARAFEEIARLRNQWDLDKAYLHEHVKEGFVFGEIVGKDPALQKVLRQVQMVAHTNATVLIGGESGTGKELIARAIHDESPRRDRPMVTVNCASVPRELFESEFFGHVKGAFTGALRDRTGRFQLADKGTIFLDEVGEIPIELQSKLLRVLQEGQFERVGDDKTHHVDVRVISATNRDLSREVEASRFRQDLYYRLCMFPIHMPPLRQRRQDIRPLAAHFLNLSCRRLNCPDVQLTEHAMELLSAYDWPGNVRELQNVIERAVILSPSGPLRIDLVLSDTASTPGVAISHFQNSIRAGIVLSQQEMNRRQHENMLAALEKTRGRIYGSGGAAEILGIRPTTLAYRLKRMGIKRPM